MTVFDTNTPTSLGPEPVATTPPAPVEAPAPLPEDAGFDQLPEHWQKEIKDKREAEGRYRTQLREYEDVFQGYQPDERASVLAYLRLTQAAQGGDQQAITELREAGLWDDGAPEPEPGIPQTVEEWKAFARAEAEQVLAVERDQRTQAESLKNVQIEAKSLGYDPNSPDYLILLKFANDMEHPDLAAADAQVKAYKQAEFDAFIARKEAEASQAATVPGNGTSPHLPQLPKTWDEARESLHERLGRLPG